MTCRCHPYHHLPSPCYLYSTSVHQYCTGYPYIDRYEHCSEPPIPAHQAPPTSPIQTKLLVESTCSAVTIFFALVNVTALHAEQLPLVYSTPHNPANVIFARDLLSCVWLVLHFLTLHFAITFTQHTNTLTITCRAKPQRRIIIRPILALNLQILLETTFNLPSLQSLRLPAEQFNSNPSSFPNHSFVKVTSQQQCQV